MAEHRNNPPALRQNRAAQRAAGQIFLHDRSFPGKRVKMTPCSNGLFDGFHNAVTLRGAQAQLFTAGRFNHQRQGGAGKKCFLRFARIRRKAFGQGNAAFCGNGMQTFFTVEQIELIRRGNAKPSKSGKPIPCPRGQGECFGAGRQQSGPAALPPPDFAQQSGERIFIALFRQGRIGGSKAAFCADRCTRTIRRTGINTRTGTGKFPDQCGRHAVLNIGNKCNHAV